MLWLWTWDEGVIRGDVYEEKLSELPSSRLARSPKWIPRKTEVLLNRPLTLRDLKGGETVVDAYCGIDDELSLARDEESLRHGNRGWCVIVMAKENAKLNGVTNVHFETGAADSRVPLEGRRHPARWLWWIHHVKGPDLCVYRSTCETSPERIVYASLISNTARPVHFSERGYEAQCATSGYNSMTACWDGSINAQGLDK